MSYNKVVFVCSSDTCRSPIAAAIMKNMLIQRPIEIKSRGLVALFPEPPNQKAVAVLISKELKLEGHMSASLSEADFGEDTLILTMEAQQKQKVLKDYKAAQNVYTFKEFIGQEGDVKDPYGGPLTDYGRCYEILYKLVEELVQKINKEEI